MNTLRCVFLAAVVVPIAVASVANGQDVEETAAQASEAQAPHAWLQRFVGSWTTTSESNAGPDQPPMECTGTMESKMLGKLWVTNRMEGTMAQGSFQAVQTIGFDPKKKRFVGTWTDTMMPHLWVYEGQLDATGNKLILETDGPDYMGGNVTKSYRDSYQFSSEDRIVSMSEIKDDRGNWTVMMKGILTRVKSDH